ncbi:MAG TPA: hypothetical protein DDW52_22710 [Planctomycetaceae bacterium]|nr:hypothetical protein [Planctomycetaceae bacterium]
MFKTSCLFVTLTCIFPSGLTYDRAVDELNRLVESQAIVYENGAITVQEESLDRASAVLGVIAEEHSPHKFVRSLSRTRHVTFEPFDAKPFVR